MADYNSDRTGSNIDAVLDKADNLTQAAVGVGGNVGIGTANPSAPLSLNRTVSDGTLIQLSKDGATVGSIGSVSGVISNFVFDPRAHADGTGIGLSASKATGDIPYLSPRNGSGTRLDGSVMLGNTDNRFKDLYLSGGVITSSDYRLKEDVQPMQSYADTIKQMNLVNFAWKHSGEREDGFIAHELQSLVPSAVRGDKDAIDEDGNEQYQGVDPFKLIPVLTKALQEALERIETLENK